MIARSKRGFTLIEIVVAMVVLAFVLSAVYSFVHRTALQLREVTTWAKAGREGPKIMALIERDLGSVFVDSRMEELFEAETIGDSVEIRFVTSRNSTLFLNGVQSDITEVGYKLEGNDEEGSLKLYTLYRREEYLMDEQPLAGGLWIPLADNIVDFSMVFYDLPEEGAGGGDLELPDLFFGSGIDSVSEDLDDWSTEDRYLPHLIKIKLKIDIREGPDKKNEEKEEEGAKTFSSIVRLPPFPRNLPEGDDELTLELNAKSSATGNNGPGSGGTSNNGGSGTSNNGGN